MNPVWHFLNGLPQVGPLRILSDVINVMVGSGGAAATVGGVLTVNTTQAATIADTNETDLWTYTLPANTLNANGKALRVTIWGATGATANNKTLKAYFGSTVVLNQTVATNAGRWRMDLIVVRTGAAAEDVFGDGKSAASSIFAPALTSATESLTASAVIKMTGTNGTAAANDIVFRGAIVETLN